MKLKELQHVRVQTELPILLFTNRLRWGDCESAQAAFEARLQLADFVTINADLQEHVFALEQVLEVCEAVAKGRYLEYRQRCHWKDHTCQYECTVMDEPCDSFDDRPPHAAVLGWLDDCQALRDMVKDWINAQGEMQPKMREGLRQFFPDLKTYKIGEDQHGNTVMAEMTADDQLAYAAPENRQHQSVANRVDQCELNLERVRVICQQDGSLQEIATLITEGLPPQVLGPIGLS